jgi:hypothetical protein
MHNEPLSVAAMCVGNPDRSSLRINRRHAAPTPTGFAEIVGDDVSVLDKEANRSGVTSNTQARGRRQERLPARQLALSQCTAPGTSQLSPNPLLVVADIARISESLDPLGPMVERPKRKYPFAV